MPKTIIQKSALEGDSAGESKGWESIIKHLAADLHAPETQVEAVLQSEVRQLQQHARIKNFVMIFAARRVKELIKVTDLSR